MVPLAGIDDVILRTTRELSAGQLDVIDRLLEGASARVRRYTGQQFTAGTSTVVLRPRGGRVRLPQRPATAVTSVVDKDGTVLEYDWAGEFVSTSDCGPITVTYTHGSNDVPFDVVDVVVELALARLNDSGEDSRLSGETIGDYSYTLERRDGNVEERVLSRLDSYRRVGTVARVGP